MKNNNQNIDWLFNKATANILKRYREEAELSLEDVVQKMKNPITRQSLFKYENNLSRIKNCIFIDICNVLKADPDEVFEEIVLTTSEYKLYIDKGYEVKTFDKNGNLMSVDLSSPDAAFDEIDILYNKAKDILNETEIDILKYLMQRAIDRNENEKKEEN